MGKGAELRRICCNDNLERKHTIMKKILKKTVVLVIGLAVATALFAPVVSKADLEPEIVNKEFLAAQVNSVGSTATNGSTARTMKVQPGENVSVTCNFAGSGSSTASQIAYLKYKCGDTPWSTSLLAYTFTAANTANVCSTVTLTNGLHFPSTVTEVSLAYLTNAAAGSVTIYHTNLIGATWKTRR